MPFKVNYVTELTASHSPAIPQRVYKKQGSIALKSSDLVRETIKTPSSIGAASQKEIPARLLLDSKFDEAAIAANSLYNSGLAESSEMPDIFVSTLIDHLNTTNHSFSHDRFTLGGKLQPGIRTDEFFFANPRFAKAAIIETIRGATHNGDSHLEIIFPQFANLNKIIKPEPLPFKFSTVNLATNIGCCKGHEH